MSTTVGAGNTEFIQAVGGTLKRLDRPASAPIELPAEPLIIGRATQCGVVLDDTTVSGTHAELTATPHGVRVRDCGSRNGTWVDGLRIVEVLVARPAQIAIGNVVFQFTPGRSVQVESGSIDRFGSLVANSSVMRTFFYRLQKIAATERTALITGESGTGKELIARAIHDASPRRAAPFVIVNCAGLSSSLADSELFGHEKGSFSGAERARISPFVEADGGTLFLDEIAELSIDLQPKLLRALQEQVVKPVGSNSYRKFNVRIIAATWRDLGREINRGTFRADLYFRLHELHAVVPPLRDRPEDIPSLVAHFAREFGEPDFVKRIPDRSMQQLMAYGFPGNVRELRNIVSRAVTFCERPEVEIEKYHSSSQAPDAPASRKYAEAEIEFNKAYWKSLHKSCEGNISRMTREAGLASREAVRHAMKKYGVLEREEDGQGDE